MLRFKRLYEGYEVADCSLTDEHFVIRTRPKNDGWMAIAGNSVIGTGLDKREAIERCNRVNKADIVDAFGYVPTGFSA